MVSNMIRELERGTKKQIEDLKSRRFQVFKAEANGSRAEEDCNAEMIATLEKQLQEIRRMIAFAIDVEHRANS